MGQTQSPSSVQYCSQSLKYPYIFSYIFFLRLIYNIFDLLINIKQNVVEIALYKINNYNWYFILTSISPKANKQTVGHRLHLENATWNAPVAFKITSVHLVEGRATLRHPIRSPLSRTFLHQRLSIQRALSPAHCHLNVLILRPMPVTPVLLRIYDFQLILIICMYK